MDVALMTEGTYPHSFGGVSVWCDQLVRGMAGHRFHVVALTGTGDEQVGWELPANVDSVTSIPLWGAPSAARSPGRRARKRFRQLIRDFLRTVVDSAEQAQFGESLRALHDYAQDEDLTASLHHDDSVDALTDAWRDGWPDAERHAPTVADALTGLQLLSHSLRPLAAPPLKAQVSHCVANGLAVLPALTAKWAHGTPFLLTEHGIYLRERYLGYRVSPYRWPVKALQLAFLRQLCSLAYREAGMIAPGNIYNKRWEERLGARHSIIRTVYNGVDPADFPAVDGEPDVPTVSWAGRIDPIKDIETLIRSWGYVHRVMPQARLRLFGGTPKGGQAYLDRCQALVEELGLGAVITFEGRVDEIRDAYAAGHVVVLSSISEGFPYTVIEAMTCGRPCVGTDVGGVVEAIGDTGIVVPPRDPEVLAGACVRLLRDDELRIRLGLAARKRALEHFTVGKAIGTFNEMYECLAMGLDGTAVTDTVVTTPVAAPVQPLPLPTSLADTTVIDRLDSADSVDPVGASR
ncbi:MAG TPA: GT4 family glycosyltransferase PelF [Pseudonocardiaceae bacterium]|jgi:glycosyltransferase involved in cell wall biosynthesis|nr:GT4 family glycosyltransferase PelF [Pseudonocardiaceae bacterium]